MVKHHQIFDEYGGFTGERPAGVIVDWIGARFCGLWDRQPEIPGAEHFNAPLPAFDEEYFEWIDLLEAVKAARQRFVMLELGAGYGRWGIRASLAAKQRAIPSFVRFVEAEPQHVAWLQGAVALNGLVSSEFSIVERAVSYGAVQVPFCVEFVGDGHSGKLDAHNWFGQAVGWEPVSATAQRYFGREVFTTPGGYSQIFVDTATLEELTADLDVIDLIDMDLQQAERDVVAHSIGVLNEKARRVHIGTHSHEIEDEIREIFLHYGWKKIWDFACVQTNETVFGPIPFVDGIQSWVNPRL